MDVLKRLAKIAAVVALALGLMVLGYFAFTKVIYPVGKTAFVQIFGQRTVATDSAPAEASAADSETSTAFAAEASGGLWLTVSDVSAPDCVAPAYALVLPLEEGELHKCPSENEANCAAATREKDTQGMIKGFCGRNPTNVYQDGYRWDSTAGRMVTGIPANWQGYMEGFTFRRTAVSNQPSQPATPPAPGATPLPSQPGVIGTATVTAQTLNVRAAPSQTAPVVGTLQKGTQITVIKTVDDNGTWLQIGDSKWIAGWLTNWPDAEAPADTQPTAPPTSTTCPPPGVTVSKTLNWRSQNNECLWNTYQDWSKDDAAYGQPVSMTLACPQDGEYVDQDGPHTPIPAGTVMVTGITARPCAPSSE